MGVSCDNLLPLWPLFFVPSQEAQQLRKLKEERSEHHEDEIDNHRDSIRDLEDQIRRHKDKIRRHKRKMDEEEDSSGSD